MARRYFYLIFISIAPLFSFGQISPQYQQKLDSLFLNWTVKDSPGGVVAVIDRGQVIYNKGFGLADLKKKNPNTPNLKYDLASNAKQFTATCIALLEEQGKISIEDEITKFYPQFHFNTPIKIKNLLDHTSGIRDASVLAMLSGRINLKGGIRKKYQSKNYYIEMLSKETDLNFAPDTELAYTNTNYVLLGDLVEKVSGMSLPRFADSAIFKPLHMNNTVFRDKRKMNIPGEAKGYLSNGKKFKQQNATGGVLGDHNLLTSMNDLILWELNFEHNKLGKGNQQLIQKITSSSKFSNGKETQYGYGLWIAKYKGLDQIYHGGDDGRQTSFIVRFAEKDFTVMVLANSSRYRDTQAKAYQVADVLLSNSLKKPEPVVAPIFISATEENMKAKTGVYVNIDEHGLAQLRKLHVTDDKFLYAFGYNRTGVEANFITADHVAIKTNTNYLHAQFTDSLGMYINEQFPGSPPIRFERMKEIKPNYQHFRGTYFNKSTGATLKIKMKKDGIVAKKGIIKIPLVVIGEDQFYAPENDALFIFQRDDQHMVRQLKVNASDFRNFKFVKN